MKKLILAAFLFSVTAGILLFGGCGGEKKSKTASAGKTPIRIDSSSVATRSSASAVPQMSVASWDVPRKKTVVATASRSTATSRKSSYRMHQEVRESLGGTYVRPARAEIHSDLLGSAPLAYSAPVARPVSSTARRQAPAAIRRVNSAFDFDGPEIGSDLDGPGFVPCKTAARVLPATPLISRSAVKTIPAKETFDFTEGPEIGWVVGKRATSRF